MEIILNADDFGASLAVNEAIQRAYHAGALTSASLMVNGAAFEDALQRIPKMPGIAVGLHLVLSEGRSVLSREQIPHLVDATGHFAADPAWAGVRYFFSPACRRELALEIRAQFEQFSLTGLPLAHVDGHQNLHAHPIIFALLLPLAMQYGAAGVRIPDDDLKFDLAYSRAGIGQKLVWSAVFGLLSRWCRRQLTGYPLHATRRVYGLLQSGHMDEDYVLRLLEQINEPSVELYFHPSTSENAVHFGPNAGDLATLLSPRLSKLIQERNLHLCNYPSLSNPPSSLS